MDVLGEVTKLVDLAGDFCDVAGDSAEATLTVRYVGDAGGGDVEPHDQTWDDSCSITDEASKLGLACYDSWADHDTIVLRFRAAP